MQKNIYATKDLDKVTRETYEVPEGEEGVFHAKIEVKRFNAQTGERQSIPRIQKFDYKAFKEVQSGLKNQGYTVEILHNPTDFIKEQQASKAAYQKRQAAERSKTLAERREAEREALKEEIRKEMEEEAAKKAKK